MELSLDSMSDLKFFKQLRISKICFDHILERIGSSLEEEGSEDLGGQPKIGSKKTLYVALWYLATEITYRELAQIFGITDSKAHHAVNLVIKALNQIREEVICWPSSDRDIVLEEEHFLELSAIKGTIGAIDGCHVEIISPPIDKQASYVNRNHYHSVNLIAVCNSKMKFTYVSAGAPGSYHDQRALRQTALWREIIKDDGNSIFPSGHYHILGDSAFQLMENLLVPYKDNGNLTVPQRNFNFELSQARRLIENSFGWIKGRFRRLKYVNTKLKKVSSVIIACAVLHNLSLDFTTYEAYLELIGEEHAVQQGVVSAALRGQSRRGVAKRDTLAASLV